MASAPSALPPRPDPPEPGSCCGNGCSPCVHDLYAAALSKWEARRAARAAGESGPAIADPPDGPVDSA